MPDPERGGILQRIHDFAEYLKDRYENKIPFLGRPVGPIHPFVASYGVFQVIRAAVDHLDPKAIAAVRSFWTGMLHAAALSCIISCMATKTISLEIDAYEKLRRAKRPGESFSAVVRRARFGPADTTGRSILESLSSRIPSDADSRAVDYWSDGIARFRTTSPSLWDESPQ